MQRLYNSRCYLVGSIDRVADFGAGWRDEITPQLEKLGITVINPLKKPVDINIEDEQFRDDVTLMKKQGRFDDIREKYKNIRNVDLRFCDISDFIVVRLSTKEFACGTLEELFWTNRMKKPVLVWSVEGKENAPTWLFLTLPHQLIFNSLKEIMSYLHNINTGENIDTLGRWFFMKFAKQTGV